jgi:transposase-like protein
MDIKTQVIHEYLETGVGYRKLAAKYGIPPLLVFFTTFNLVYWHLFTV